MRIGLFGGTFDPVHNGHMTLAEAAKDKLNLDKVIFIPAYIPPHKTPEALAEAEDRYKMIELAIDKRPGFEISRFEIGKKDKSYSIETLKYFKGSYPKDTEFFFLIGADSLKGLSSWKDIDKLLGLCRFAVCNRPGFPNDAAYTGMEAFDITPVGVSSTNIRRKIKNGQGISGLIPRPVEDYIRKKNLYK